MLVETGHKENVGKLPDSRNVANVGAVRVAIPLRIVIPHRVAAAMNDCRDRFQIERKALGEEDEIGLKAAGSAQREKLRGPSPEQSLGAPIVEEQRVVSGAPKRPLNCGFHAPGVAMPDEKNAHVLRNHPLAREFARPCEAPSGAPTTPRLGNLRDILLAVAACRRQGGLTDLHDEVDDARVATATRHGSPWLAMVARVSADLAAVVRPL